MITTADLIDICSLYYLQSAMGVRLFATTDWDYKIRCFRCSMYALSACLILEEVY